MKHLFLSFAIVVLALCTSCEKDDDIKKDLDAYEWSRQVPKSELDNSSAGIYLGVSKDQYVAFSLQMKNDGKNVGGKIFYYGDSYELIPDASLLAMIPGQVVDGSFSFKYGELSVGIGGDGTINTVYFPMLDKQNEVEINSSFSNQVLLRKKLASSAMDIYLGEWKEKGFEKEMIGGEINENVFDISRNFLFLMDMDSKRIFHHDYLWYDESFHLFYTENNYSAEDGRFFSTVFPDSGLEMVDNTLSSNVVVEQGSKDSDYHVYYTQDIKTEILF